MVKVNRSVTFSAFRMLHNHHFGLVPKHFITWKPHNYKQLLPIPPFLEPQQPPICFVSLLTHLFWISHIDGICVTPLYHI